MNRREFLKSAALMTTAGAMFGKGAVLKAAESAAVPPQGPVLNFNPQMQYRPMGRTGVNVSALGFGLLRLPMLADGKTVDAAQSVAMIRRAIEGGVNYIDTGRVYLGGQSEAVAGKALKGNWRDRVYVTSKSPWWIMERPEDFEKFFDESRRAIGTDVIDFYHIHMIMHRGWKEKVIPFKLIDRIMKLKEQGKIRFAGFSFHDRPAAMKTLIDTGEFSSVLFQYNLLDVANAEMIAYAAGKGLGTVAMGPVGGGRLAFAGGVFEDALGGKFTAPELALRFVLANPAVSCALSGMGSAAMVDANTRVASDADPLTEPELAALVRVREQCGELRNLYCTGCNYCGPSCPEHVRIPAVLEALIYDRVYGFREHARSSYARIGSAPDKEERNASACVGCGLCESKCPQKLPIRKPLAEARALFEG